MYKASTLRPSTKYSPAAEPERWARSESSTCTGGARQMDMAAGSAGAETMRMQAFEASGIGGELAGGPRGDWCAAFEASGVRGAVAGGRRGD